MVALFLKSLIPTTPEKFMNSIYRCDRYRTDGSLWKKKSIMCCQSSENVTTSSGLSSILTERTMGMPTTGKTGKDKALMDKRHLALAPNGRIQEQILVKDPVPCGVTSTTLMEFNDGLGILKFFSGKVFLITGATGFIAKVLIEKILRTIPDVGKIFLLIKAKNKEAAMDRLKNEVINTELFKCLQQTHGNSYQAFMLGKLVPVVGNICEANIGIETDLAEEIAEEVDVIVNSAATTNFDERYDIALDINTRGPCRIMSFAKTCKQLKLFLQISTAYANGPREGKILEKAFCIGDNIARKSVTSESTPKSLSMLDIEAEIELATNSKKSFKDNVVAQKMKELGSERAQIYGWQDTYSFTKAMGEMLLGNVRGEIPVVIVRPSIVESTYKEPFPGWIEGFRMLDPIILYYGKGHITSFLGSPKGIMDLIPVDMVVNAVLAAMAKHGVTGRQEISIYHVASSAINQLVFQDVGMHSYEHFSSSPYMDSRGMPVHIPEMKLFSSMDEFSSHAWTHTVQRSGGDVAGKELGNLLKKTMGQLTRLANIYKPYTSYRGRFDISNTQKLMEDMSEEERKNFGFDAGSIDWKNYICDIHIPGLRKHVMKGRGMCEKVPQYLCSP